MVGDAFYILVYATLEMLNYVGIYRILFQAQFRKNKMWIVGSYLAGYMLQILVWFLVDSTWIEIINILYWIIIPICWFEKRKKQWFLLYPFVVAGTTMINISATFFMAVLLDISEAEVINSRWKSMCCECTCILFLAFLFLYRRIKKQETIEIQMHKMQYILLLTGLLCSMLIVGSAQILIGEETLSVRLRNWCGFAIAFVCVIFVLMSLWQGIVLYRELQYKNQTELYEDYMKMQEKHMQELLDHDEKMRRFRHDLHAHVTVLREYCRQKDYFQLQNYIDEMEQNSCIHERKQYTGHRAIDAIIQEFVEEAERETINFQCKGNLPEQKRVSVYDLCTIISNLLKNSIEACRKIPDLLQKKIEIDIYSYNEQISILVKNTVVEEIKIEEQELATTKEDKQEHGFGSQNVKAAVIKYGGSVEYKYEDGWFWVEVIL